MKSRITRQKELLQRELDCMTGFFSAEEFHSLSLHKMPNLGIATIYRFLNEKSKNRQLHSYYCDKRTVYSNSKNNHCHYVCQNCGEKRHIEIKNIDSIKKSITGTICHFQIDVYGICDKCLKKRTNH
ncbi:MAG: transcriptional repressor [Candidatus Woesearchaeota archaeon]